MKEITLEAVRNGALKAIKPSGTSFGYCINCYNRCEHGCQYCYGMKVAHNNHTDWVKPTPRLKLRDWLQKDLEILKHHPEIKSDIKDIMVSSVTDCYQPIESEHRITRNVITILIENELPFTILTKSKGVLADIDLFKSYDKCKVGFTIITLDDTLRAMLEPNTSTIDARCDALEKLKQNGVNTYCSVEPIMPDIRSDPIAIVNRLKHCVDLFEFGKWNPDKNSQAIVEQILGVSYNESYYVDVFKKINQYCDTLGVNYCHAGHSQEFLQEYGIKFIPSPTIINKVRQ